MHTLVTHAGVIHVESMEELVDVSQILVRCAELPAGGPAIFTESGAFKALALDLCEQMGSELPALSSAAERALREALACLHPSLESARPDGAGARGSGSVSPHACPQCSTNDRFGSVVLGIILTDPKTTALKLPPILDAIRTLKPRKPIIFAALDEGAPFDFAELDELRDLGVSCFPSPERAIRALAHVTSASCAPGESDTGETEDWALPSIEPGPSARVQEQADRSRSLGSRSRNGRLARCLDEAIQIAEEIGFPVVLKAQAADLPHKTDAGGVLLGLESAEASSRHGLRCIAMCEAHQTGIGARWCACGTHGEPGR